MRYVFVVLSLAVLLPMAGLAQAADAADRDPDVSYAFQGMPQDVVAWMDKLANCAHLANDPATSEQMERDNQQALKDAKCDALGHQESLLRQRYPKDEKVIRHMKMIKDYYQPK